MTFEAPPSWHGDSTDPNDEQFGDVISHVSLDSADEYDAVIVGEPYDGAVIGRPGAHGGPSALRAELATTKTYHFSGREIQSVADLGDVALPEGTVSQVQHAAYDATSAVYDTGVVPVFLGGDNSLTVPNVSPLVDRGSVGVISFDAHLDCREVGDEPTSGTPYRQLFESGLAEFAVVGARHFETAGPYAEFVEEKGGTIVTASEVGTEGVTVIDRILDDMAHVDSVYLSVDLDVLDTTAAPGVSAPTPGGLTTRELFELVHRAAEDHRVAGFEVVEYSPPLDIDKRTAHAGARVVAHFLAGLHGEVRYV
ncbi:formimidoylglutamase [Haladaptatus sp. DYSN1]|uniref:formimidoylglutamase n=1 Tax=unclassified Haladaptatus TaxID=2622732 RepID=UPI002404AD0E|nr:formimidoylglutamase [Haladaptatus sp. DYSN1]